MELLICPFCGSTMHTKAGMNCWYAHCSSCWAEGPPRDTEAEAIAAANRRASRAGAAVSADLHHKIVNLPCEVPHGYPFGSELCVMVYQKGHRDARRAAEELVSAALSAATGSTPTGWISVEERMPDAGTDCLVWCTVLGPGRHFAKVDRWDEQRESPVGWSSATIPTGLGWNDSDYEDISHWTPLPQPPVSAAMSAPTTQTQEQQQ